MLQIIWLSSWLYINKPKDHTGSANQASAIRNSDSNPSINPPISQKSSTWIAHAIKDSTKGGSSGVYGQSNYQVLTKVFPFVKENMLLNFWRTLGFGCKLAKSPMQSTLKLSKDGGPMLTDPTSYWGLIGRLLCPTLDPTSLTTFID